MHTVGLVDPEVHQDGRLRVKHGSINFDFHAGKMLEHGTCWRSRRPSIKHQRRADVVVNRFVNECDTVF